MNKNNTVTYDKDFHLQLAETVADILKLRIGYTDDKIRTIHLNGLTRHNFTLQVLYAAKEAVWKLRVMHSSTKQKKDELIASTMSDLPDYNLSEFVRNSSSRVQYEVVLADPDLILEQSSVLAQYVEENDLGCGTANSEPKVGVSFRGTQFDRLKERGATISGMFGNLVCQASGMRLEMMQAEYYIESGEVDGVEFDEYGKVIAIYECQSGIHHGEELDDEHMMKALGTYLYDSEIIPTVRKVVVLAGAYSEMDLTILRNRALELSRRDQPIELVVLITTRVENKIGIERLLVGV
jgi:hypothetical protein